MALVVTFPMTYPVCVCVCVSIESECLFSSSVCTVRILGHGAPSIIVSSRKQDRGKYTEMVSIFCNIRFQDASVALA